MSIPLIQDNNKDSINTSIIAIKRNIERINMLLGLSDSGSSDPDLSGLATKQELQDAVNSLQPVDEVTLNNMHSVTSNAVSKAISYSTTEHFTGKYWIDGKKIYAKTFTHSWGSSGGSDVVNIDITSLSVDSIIKGEGIMQGNSNIFTKGYAPMTYISSTSSGTANGYFWNVNEAKSTLTFRSQGTGLSTKMFECTFTLEYTKTTD